MASNTKQALLQALSAAEGGYISGQRLAETLGVSRAIEGFGWIPDEGGSSVGIPVGNDGDELTGNQVGSMG